MESKKNSTIKRSYQAFQSWIIHVILSKRSSSSSAALAAEKRLVYFFIGWILTAVSLLVCLLAMWILYNTDLASSIQGYFSSFQVLTYAVIWFMVIEVNIQ